MKPLLVEERTVTSFDGTELAVHRVGEGPPVLLAAGLGGSWRAWTHVVAPLRDRYRFIAWDYRGLYRSSAPADRERLRVEDHAADALAVLDASGVGRAAVLGWSMGVQVALELFRRHPERVSALVLVNGVAGRPWSAASRGRVTERAVRRLLSTLRAFPALTQGALERLLRGPETVAWLRRVGLVGPTADADLLLDLARALADLDFDLFVHTLELLGEHDATDVLPGIDVPTLVIAGDRDSLTPRRASERIVRDVHGAELMVVPGGTHFVLLESPELVSLRIEKFFRERGVPLAAPLEA